MYLADHARLTPDKPAVIMAETGQVLTYAELDDRSNQFARWLRAQGLRQGDHIAILMENNLRYMEVCWAALRSGLYFTAINAHLPVEEAAYIVADCAAKVIVSSSAKAEMAGALTSMIETCPHRLMVDGVIPGWEAYEQAIQPFPTQPVEDEALGAAMLYSSGTTGRPKGILRALTGASPAQGGILRRAQLTPYDVSADMIYLSPAPLYHAAPNTWVLACHFLGATAVVMEKFDALQALQLIERHKVTHSQWVPTMFVRMLKLPPDERAGFDLSSHRIAIHAAAPCPVDVKRQMIDWWGPILLEYYGGTEGAGTTFIDSRDWLAHPGSVGRASLGILHVCDDEGRELPAGEAGTIYFERDDVSFVYHNDPAKTQAARHPDHATWSALGDVGYVDEEGFLYLTDRKAFMIISGGVNIYPQAVEDALIGHPAVADVAVVGIPHPEMGEAVKAVVETVADVAPSRALAEELMAFARERVAHYAAPRSIDFIAQIPRLPTGKLYKRSLSDEYRQSGRLAAAIPID